MNQDISNHVFTPKPIGVRDVLLQLFRERVLCRNVFFLVLLSGSLVGLSMGTVYKSQASILLLPSREYVYSQEVGANVNTLNMTSEEFVLSEAEMFKDRRLIRRTLEDVGIARLYPPLGKQLDDIRLPLWKDWLIDVEQGLVGFDGQLERRKALEDAKLALIDAAVTRFQKNLKVWTVKDANVISLSFNHKDPVQAADALSSLVGLYQEQRRRIYSQMRSGMFMAQRNRYADRLADMEREIANFKLSNDISAFADQKSLLVRQKAELSASRIDAETKLREVVGRLEAVRKKIAQVPAEVLNYQENMVEDSASAARNSLVSLEARRTELLTKFRPDSQYVKDLNEQVKAMRELRDSSPPMLSHRRQVARNPVLEELEMENAKRSADAASLNNRLQSLKEQEGLVDAQLRNYDRLESTFNSLTINRAILEENFKTYSQKVEEALIQEEMDRQKMDNVRVIEEPEAPRQGVNMFKILTLLSMILGGVLAMATALLRHYLRQTFLSPQDAERGLGLPVLVAIPLKTPTAP
jgi:uncharacterized protein involved in exopolysaccharide biosynthesis